MLMKTLPDPADTPTRDIPHSIEAEQALLGALLLNNEVAERVGDILEAAHFADGLHAHIYDAVMRLVAAGKVASPVTLRPQFDGHPPIHDGLTVPQYLGRLAAHAVTTFAARDYAEQIRDFALRRRLIEIGTDIVASAYEVADTVSPRALVEEAERALFDLGEKQAADKDVPFGAAVCDAIDAANRAYQRAGHLAGLSTGLTDLDAKLGGLVDGNLIIIAGRPGMGKTALATSIAWAIARDGTDDPQTGEIIPAPVQFFSLEMTRTELAARILATESGVSADKSRRGMIDEADMRKLVAAGTAIRETPLRIDDAGGLTIAQIATRARRAKRLHGIRAVVIDYLQLIQGSGRENRTQDLTQITMGLKALAKDVNVPVIALSQLSREVEKRTDKRPHLSDLRESGSIEQDADVVMFVFREEYYVERDRPTDPNDVAANGDWMCQMSKVAGKADIIIGKNRHGSVGAVSVAFDPQRVSFGNLAREHELSERYA